MIKSSSIVNINMKIISNCTAPMKIHYHPHQMYSPDEDYTSTKLKTSKEELKTGKAVVDAKFRDLSGIVNVHLYPSRYILIFL